MSVEANIIFREKPAAIVVPAEAIAGDSVQTIDDGQVGRVPIKVGIRGNRNTEIIGDIAKGTPCFRPHAVISPTAPGSASTTAWPRL